MGAGLHKQPMDPITRARNDLAIANRILARHGLFDVDGHISVRHPADPARYLLAGAKSAAFVEPGDVMEFALDGTPVGAATAPLLAERFIHGAVYERRPDLNAVLYAPGEDLAPFGVTAVPLRAVIAPVGDMGLHVPVWDIAERFGAATDLLVSSMERARDLAQRLGPHRVALVRGGGFVSTGRTLNDAVRMSFYVPKNARAQAASLALGEIKPIAEGESQARLAIDPESNAMRRGWDYWAREAACSKWLGE